MSNPAMEFTTNGGPASDYESYHSPFVASDDAFTTSNESALVLDGVPGAALPNDSESMYHPPAEAAEADIERSMQSEPEPISQEQLIMKVKAIYAATQKLNLRKRWHPENHPLQSEPEPISREQLTMEAKAIDAGLGLVENYHIQSLIITRWQLWRLTYADSWSGIAEKECNKGAPEHEMPGTPDESTDKISWMDHVLRYAMANATEGASDSKHESKNVTVVRDGLDGEFEGPSHLESSPTRKYLPMILKGKTIGAQHDTGAEDHNFMTSKLAGDLQLRVRTKESDRKSFSMGTGKVQRAIGRVRAPCAFAKETGTKMKLWFYILPRLTSQLIMGSQFLRDTQTMSHFTHRLEDLLPCTPCVPMVNLISPTQQAKRRLVAFIDGRQTYINADTGSHLDLMSAAYRKKYGYKLDRRRECRKRLLLADATAAETIGQVRAELTLHDGSTYLKTFDVLPGLISEVLIGEDTLAELKIFAEHESSFMDVWGGERHFELSILKHLGFVNEFLVRKLSLSNRRSQTEYQLSLAKQEDDKIMEALPEQDLEAERHQREMKRLEASGALLEKGKRVDGVQAPEPTKLPQASQSPSVSSVPQSSTTRSQANSHEGV